jgi:hypothetical protein
MFGLMKHFLKEKISTPNSVKLTDMHVGCVVGFGFMPQKNISGRRLPVTEINSYLFEDDSFVSFRLENGNTDVSVIIADEDESGTYLALSQRIEERLVSPLFSSRHPRGWFALKEGDKIIVNRDILGVPVGWLVSRYKVVMSTKGKLLEGDFRLRKPTSYASLAKPFDYVLLVDEANEYALEAEQYEDGSCHVYSTVYRPATDIGEISRPQLRPVIAGGDRFALLEEKIEHVPPSAPIIVKKDIPASVPLKTEALAKQKPKELPLKEHDKREEELVKPRAKEAAKQTAKDAVVEIQSKAAVKEEPVNTLQDVPVTAAPSSLPAAPPPEQSRKTVEEPVHSADIQEPVQEAPQKPVQPSQNTVAVVGLTEIAPVHGKFGRIQPTPAQMPQQQPTEMLPCDIALAGRIIDEAQRNQLLISELIRKVIDLPARIQDHVLIPFSLSDAEYAELARRYGLQPSDRMGVMGRILEELRQFAGQKA